MVGTENKMSPKERSVLVRKFTVHSLEDKKFKPKKPHSFTVSTITKRHIMWYLKRSSSTVTWVFKWQLRGDRSNATQNTDSQCKVNHKSMPHVVGKKCRVYYKWDWCMIRLRGLIPRWINLVLDLLKLQPIISEFMK